MILMFLALMGFLFYLHRTHAEDIPVELVPLVIFVGLVSWWIHHMIMNMIEDND